MYRCIGIYESLRTLYVISLFFPPLCAAPQLNKVPLIHSNLEEDPEAVRQDFRIYLGNVVQSLSESREREEMSIIA